MTRAEREHAARAAVEVDTLRTEIDRLSSDLAVLRRRLAWAQQDLHRATGSVTRGDLVRIA